MTEGNSAKMSQKDNLATTIVPPMPPRADMIFNETGSNDGFAAYVFCAPEQKLGIVILANKHCPNEKRTKAAFQVMEKVMG